MRSLHWLAMTTMPLHFPKITDWSAAYDNRAAVPAVDAWMAALAEDSCGWRASGAGRVDTDLAHGPHARDRHDVWHPAGRARGTLVFLHGGYWRAGHKDLYAALARPVLAAGWRAAFVTYPLCPEVTIGRIATGVQAAVECLAAQLPDGPLILSGHSAGGHLATWLVSTASTLPAAVRARIPRVVSLSGVHDLRPLVRCEALNRDLGLDAAEAARLSPVLALPGHDVELVCIAGGAELAEFRRQNALLASLWAGAGIATRAAEVDGANHFTLLDGLLQPRAPLLPALIG